MSVVAAVRRDLDALGGDIAESALAASALALAAELDDAVAEEACEECGHVQEFTVGHNSATSKSMCARELRETMAKIREMAPPKEKKGELHDIKSARARRLAGGESGA